MLCGWFAVHGPMEFVPSSQVCLILVKVAPAHYHPVMKLLVSTLFLLGLFSHGLQAQDSKTDAPIKIKASEAKANIGTNAIVTGKIAEVNKTERLVRLNFDEAFPKSTFTAVIFSNKMSLFPDVEKLKDKTVEVSGKIAAYRERPQIVLTNASQLKVVEKAEEKK